MVDEHDDSDSAYNECLRRKADEHLKPPFGLRNLDMDLDDFSEFNPYRVSRHKDIVISNFVYRKHSGGALEEIEKLVEKYSEAKRSLFMTDIHMISKEFCDDYYIYRTKRDIDTSISSMSALINSIKTVKKAIVDLSRDAVCEIAEQMFHSLTELQCGVHIVSTLYLAETISPDPSGIEEDLRQLTKAIPESASGDELHAVETWHIGALNFLGYIEDYANRAIDNLPMLRPDPEWGDVPKLEEDSVKLKRERAKAIASTKIDQAWDKAGFGKLGGRRRPNILKAVLGPLLGKHDTSSNFQSLGRSDRQKR